MYREFHAFRIICQIFGNVENNEIADAMFSVVLFLFDIESIIYLSAIVVHFMKGS